MTPRVFVPVISAALALLHAWWPLIIGADVLAYAVWSYAHPFIDCWACKATGRNRGSTRRRRGKCWRCRGTREIQAPGSRVLHRLVRSLREHAKARKGW
jgi:hypothetical protein